MNEDLKSKWNRAEQNIRATITLTLVESFVCLVVQGSVKALTHQTEP